MRKQRPDRRQAIDDLMELDGSEVAAARIVRFERAEDLADYAAACLLEQEHEDGGDFPADEVIAELAGSKRPPAVWLEQVLSLSTTAVEEVQDAWRNVASQAVQRARASDTEVHSLAASLLLHQRIAAAAEIDLEAERRDALTSLRYLHGNEVQWYSFIYRLENEYGMKTRARGSYEAFIEVLPPNDSMTLFARYALGEMLFDEKEYDDAAEVMNSLVEILRDDELEKPVEAETLEANELASRGLYFRAIGRLEAGAIEEATQLLDAALKEYPNDADVLIALHRLPDANDQRKEKTRRQIVAAAQHFAGLITKSQRQDRERASWCNQFAWLVGNTGIGPTEKPSDVDLAIKYSQQSIQMRGESDAGGYYDTLAHCYFYGKDDPEKAVQIQRKAVRLEPHTRQIVEKLTLFEKELEQRRHAAES